MKIHENGDDCNSKDLAVVVVVVPPDNRVLRVDMLVVFAAADTKKKGLNGTKHTAKTMLPFDNDDDVRHK